LFGHASEHVMSARSGMNAYKRLGKVVSHVADGLDAKIRHKDAKSTKTPIKVVLTGAAGNIGYAMCLLIGNGRLLGPNQPVDLRLLEIPGMEKKLEGTAMEIRDGAYPVIAKITCTTDAKVAFDDCEVALLVGAMPRKAGMLRSELMRRNASIFKAQGKAINKYANRNVKVLVVGNPANANAMVASHFAPDIPSSNFTALTRLDQNRAVSQLSTRLLCDVSKIKNVIVWGNHSKTMYPDVTRAYIEGPFGARTSISEAVSDDKWLRTKYLDTVRSRGAAVIKVRGSSSAASAANAACDHIRDWFLGSSEPVSMAVTSDGSYGIPKGIVCSFPVVCKGGWKFEIVKGLSIDSFSRAAMDATAKELVEQKNTALAQ